MIIPVKDTQSLKRAVNHKVQLKEIAEKYGFEGFYLFTTNQLDGSYLVESRFFNPSVGIDEDPATGTAAGPLIGFLELQGYIQKNRDYFVMQGKYMDQPSIIRAQVAEDGIWVSGSSIIVMEGQIYV